MHKSTAIRTGVASAVAAAGLAVGGIAVANAADDTTTPSAPSSEAGRPGPGGPDGRGHGGPARDDAALAKALGVSESKLQAAQKSVRESLKPAKGEKPDPAADQSAYVKALAKKLGLSEAKVTAAMESVRVAHDKERRSDLSDRLDQAVEDGKLTSDDKASVLKAFDAGVLGGPGPR